MNKEQLVSMLRKTGHKVTPQRLAICKEVLSSQEHPTAEMIFERVAKQYPGLSMTTVYHTLDMLKKLELVHELGFNSKPSRFDPNTSTHINIICQKCGKISDYQSEAIQDYWNRIVLEMKLEPVGQRLDIYVVCEDCRN